jgi:hypothetical protein
MNPDMIATKCGKLSNGDEIAIVRRGGMRTFGWYAGLTEDSLMIYTESGLSDKSLYRYPIDLITDVIKNKK